MHLGPSSVAKTEASEGSLPHRLVVVTKGDLVVPRSLKNR